MKKNLSLGLSTPFALKTIIFVVLVSFANISNAQIIAWQFALPTPSKGVEKSINATTNNENLEISVLTRGSGAKFIK